MAVEKLSLFRAKLDALRSERERLAGEIKKLARQIDAIDEAIKMHLNVRAEDLKQEKRERDAQLSRKRK